MGSGVCMAVGPNVSLAREPLPSHLPLLNQVYVDPDAADAKNLVPLAVEQMVVQVMEKPAMMVAAQPVRRLTLEFVPVASRGVIDNAVK
ncbi:MAG: hypothetical protein QOI13_2981 [Paraburkholderia sp.]|nr:hypothetical protein [Paraburkholderia sp.]